MSESLAQIDAALRQLIDAVRSHSDQHLNKLPLRPDDVAQWCRALFANHDNIKRVAELQAEYVRKSALAFDESTQRTKENHDDRRFREKAWSELPWFAALRAQYLAQSSYIEQLVALAELPQPVSRRVRFFASQLVDALSPSNFPATNPTALARSLETQGENFVRGANALLTDLAKGQITMTDESAFKVGSNLAATPGDVIFENELIQLIQYKPHTETTHARPLLIVPPFINKFYILDLQPKNSFVKYCVSEGISTFMISWRNIPPELGRLGWDDYVHMGVHEAINTVHDICDGELVNVLGFCVGGTLLASALAVANQLRVASLTLLATMLDYSDTGDISVYVHEEYVSDCERQYANGGCVTGSQLANAFASLRARELVWHFVENNYLLGDTPHPFDLLYWNTDSANLPGRLYAWYLRNMYLENNLRVPGRLCIRERPVDLGSIDHPAYLLAAREDHIVPWKSAFRSARLLGGETTFALASSGHVAGIVNPPGSLRRYWVSEHCNSGMTPDTWIANANELPGSWWPHWLRWLRERSGPAHRSKSEAGNTRHRPIESAPGRYVSE